MKLIDNEGKEVYTATAPFKIGALSQQTASVDFKFPKIPGDYWLRTYAVKEDGSKTLCRRKIRINN